MADKDKQYRIPVGIGSFRYDGSLRLERANEGFFSLLKMTKEEFTQKYENCYDRLLCREVWFCLKEKIEECLESREMLQTEFEVCRKGCRKEWRQLQAAVLQDGDGLILQCMFTDISEIKRAYLKLEQEKEKLNVIAGMSGEMLFEYDIENDYMDYTSRKEEMPGDEYFTKDFVKNIKKLMDIFPEDSDSLKQFSEDLQTGKKHIYAEMKKRHKDATYHWVEIEGATLFDYCGRPFKVIGRIRNIDERKKKEEQFRLSMERDSLTGLYNHHTIVSKIKNRLREMEKGQTSWLIIIDVDNFKLINDTNGHLVGDAVLCMVADELQSSVRKGLLGRIGGDEFIAYVEDMSRVRLEELLFTLNSTIQDVFKDKEKDLKVSCSVGVAQCDGDSKEFDQLFQWADYALYKVKQADKNGYRIVKAKGKVPESGYLTRDEEEEYIREEGLIQSEDEFVLFALELLENVSDIQSGLKMVSDRICSFFNIDDIVYISDENNILEKKYHWSRKKKRQTEKKFLPESKAAWSYIRTNFDKKGMAVIRKAEIRKMPGEQVESILFIRPDKGKKERGYIVFLDRYEDRSWEKEKEVLFRLAGIIYNKLWQQYDSEREKSKVEYQLNYDALTGLLQYPRFITLAEQYMKENEENSFYFVYSDFANFQYMNELYGYTEGDKILKAFAEQVQKLKTGVYFTRVTSDHFVGLLEGENEEEVRKAYLETTRKFCEKINRKYGQSNLVLVSGFSRAMDAMEMPSYAIDRANVARKYGKQTTSTVVVVYNQEIKEKNEAEKSISANRTAALKNGEFQAWLQPKISLHTGKVVGAEALVRWQKADGSMIYPDSFIPVFEKNGFITKVDFAVLDQVLSYLREALSAGEQVVPVSVNFSRRHNEAPDFVDQIFCRLQEKNIPSGYLEAEITESVFMLDLSTLTGNLKKLKQNGIAISIDDFGSGYSSLNVLANVEADVIKLDKKFLEYARRDSKAPVFVKYLIKMMKELGYKVIAEGVETKEQLDLLKNADCDMVQGYYYAKPMTIFAFREFLKEFNKQNEYL